MIGAEAFAGEYLGAFVESLQPDYACFFILVFFRPGTHQLQCTARCSWGRGEKMTGDRPARLGCFGDMS